MIGIESFEELMLGTRLKRLSEHLFSQVDKIYQQHSVELPGSCFAPFILLLENGAMGITELATLLGQTHSAVSQTSKKLIAAGLVEQATDEKDERRRLLRPSQQGIAFGREVKPVWQDIRLALNKTLEEDQSTFMASLTQFEHALEDKSLFERAKEIAVLRQRNEIEIIGFETCYASDFKKLNIAWLEKYFYVEAIDDQVLSNPQQYILDSGGHILFARYQQEIVGTCCLIRAEDGAMELSKMAVSEQYQGLGIGKKLALAAIELYNTLDSHCLFLESNSKLKPALKLYEQVGFVHKKPKDDSHYQRADVYMVYQPK